ncbi:AlpA family phage regulatory protein [Qipengyuania flava]|uniref:AlpA family phage regulatory protein n=1 Tax=Qipengyuania flava TaxID=192812 RepID=A0A5P6NCU1_9SPHN|nr:AlpA family phage regulatory protein [Qipengyuania flava]QFI63765.1 AlpA family phage regulatory protein [Qipengyuania flava]
MAQLLTPKAVCEKIALSRATLDRLVTAGDFPAPVRLTPKRLAFDAAKVDRWIDQKLGEAA